MLTLVLCLVLGLLSALGIAVAASFRSFYLRDAENDLLREMDDINEIAVTRYVDMEKRPAAKEELQVIVRLHDACLQLCFDSGELGRYIAYGNAADRWGVVEDADIQPYIDAVRSGEYEECSYGILTKYTGFPTLTVMRPIETEEGEDLGVMFFHYDMTGVNSSIRAVLTKVALISLIAIAFAIPLVMTLVRQITHPISHMTDVVKEFAKGNFESRAEVKGRDELANLGASFNTMADELNTLEEARRSFVANVSHELRSPLTSMRGFLEAMSDGTIPPEEYGQYIDIVLDENRRMTVMVNDLLDLARIESGQYKLNITDFELTELVRRILITFVARITAKRFHMEVDLNGDEPVYVEADEARISQVLHNLIDNAIKYTPEGGFIRVECGSENRREKRIATFSITNSGDGIPEAALPHVFDRFYKAETAHTRAGASGTGLGLSIAKLILEQHGQDIAVTSKEGVTCFSFTLAEGEKPHAKKEEHLKLKE
jgi:signal transduction histidine kinase